MSAKRRVAKDALENGPDISTVQLGLKTHAELAKRTRAHEEVVEQRDEAARMHDSAKGAADRVREKQAELDRRLEKARKSESSARAALAAGVTDAQVDVWTAAHARHQAASEESARASRAVRSAEAVVQPLRTALRETESAAAESSERLEKLRSRAGVLGLVDLLEVGSDCPLCLQVVHELPAHDLDIHVRQAQREDEAAQALRREAKQAYEDAERELITRRSDAASALKGLTDRESDIASIPPSDQLDVLREEAAELTETVRTAEGEAEQAETAARQHRESATSVDALERERIAEQRVTGLSASETVLRAQLASLRSEAAALPGRDELSAQLAEVKRLQAELEKADSGFNEAEARYERVAAELKKVNRRHAHATEHLHASRDRVAAFTPPPIDTTDLTAAWAVLTEWIEDQIDAATSRRQAAIGQQSAKADSRSAAVDALRRLCIDIIDGVDPDASVVELGELLTTQRASSSTELEHFDRRRDELEQLRERIGALNDRAVVATHLGQLLRTDGFESWLMEAALEQLVDRATGRLLELSDGQYSLTVHKRDFAVRDHTNADEVRSARTLSGGETFLASLSLALAVADATAELAPEGAPRMESIFLDEGFGTLDPHTLDTVATAVEELGTTGRFVGIVTHIRELADRMPVRLEVTKTGGSATVERIET